MKNKSYKHWLVVACMCGLSASSLGCVINTAGVFYTPLSEALNVGRGAFALNATLTSIAIAIAGLLLPKLLDKVNFKLLILVGGILAGGSTILMGFSNSLTLFYVLGVFKGLGSVLYNLILITTIINHWFKEKVGTATSIVLSFSGVVGAIMSPLLTSIITNYSWQMSYIVLGIITFALTLPAVLVPYKLYPSEEGLLPYGATEEVQQTATTEEVKFNPVNVCFILFVFVAIILCAITSMSSHLIGYAQSVGIATSVSALMLSCVMIGNIVSKLVIGALSDIVGALKSTFIMMAVLTASIVVLMLIHAPSIMLVSAFLFGSIYGICATGVTLLTKTFFGTKVYSKAYSIVQFGTNMGSAFALTLFGYVYDLTGSYIYDLYLGIGFILVSYVLLTYINKHAKVIE